MLLRFRCLRKDPAQFVVDIGIGRYCGPHIDADGRGIDQFDLAYTVRCQRGHMGRKFFPFNDRLKSGDQ